jgi:hypothetical protein
MRIKDGVPLYLPDESAISWRYMDLAKFVYLLDKRSLHFRRADKFEDKYEGLLPLTDAENLKSSLAHHQLTPDLIDKAIKLDEKSRESFYLNCWHINKEESSSMWKAYSASAQGIAIQSTVSNIGESFHLSIEPIRLSLVSYLNYKIGTVKPGNTFRPVIHKRHFFKEENELRVNRTGFTGGWFA